MAKLGLCNIKSILSGVLLICLHYNYVTVTCVNIAQIVNIIIKLQRLNDAVDDVTQTSVNLYSQYVYKSTFLNLRPTGNI